MKAPTLILLLALVVCSSAAKLELLRELVNLIESKRGACDNVVGASGCGSGTCIAGKQSEIKDWDKPWFCIDCDGPNKGSKKKGGRHCEVDDPCGSSKCKGNEFCLVSTYTKSGSECFDKGLYGEYEGLLRRMLETHAREEPYLSIRSLMARDDIEDPNEALLRLAREQLVDQ